MKTRTYNLITNVCVLVAVASALVFDKSESIKWLVAGLGAIAGIVSLVVYFYNHWHPESEYNRRQENFVESAVEVIKADSEGIMRVNAMLDGPYLWEIRKAAHAYRNDCDHYWHHHGHVYPSTVSSRFLPLDVRKRVTSLERPVDAIGILMNTLCEVAVPIGPEDPDINNFVFVITVRPSSAGDAARKVIFEVTQDGQIMVHAASRARASREDYVPYTVGDLPFGVRQPLRSKQKGFQEAYGLRYALAKS